ncbi:hypothetical protein DK389_13295 [Methylobacterium durans]|uniref:Uncharacterized protein n=2 Tax=Methylobacterium durans TaxID=2202825 RepID=A0A2U8W720_9HYPH|nr:hypothetical protein DK389_13295 [Methylobacterium durans]
MRQIAVTYEEIRESLAICEDFHINQVESIARLIQRCGTPGAFACGSYWCTPCRRRFGARLLADTRTQLTKRYGTDLEQARPFLLHVTILNDIVIPDPDLDRDFGANFSASTVRRDHRELLSHLRRWQSDRRSALCQFLDKRHLSLELIEDWVLGGNRDRTFYSADNLYADARRLVALNDVIALAHDQFKSRRSWLKDPPSEFVSWRDKDRPNEFMFQLRRAQKLDYKDIYRIAQDLQNISRAFCGITKTRFPERLKYLSSIRKVLKRERSRLYRLNKDLPGLSLIGQFELELVDLRHSIGGTHHHTTKSKTLRILASQERKPSKPRNSEGPVSFETQRRRLKQGAKMRLLDEARERIARNEELPKDEFPGLQYAVLLHMHVLIDLNGHSRDDVERWLTGKEVGERRFTGRWPLQHQVMTKKLFDDKPVDDSLRHISFYPFKAPIALNYENTAPKQDEDLAEGDPANFPDEALALIAWLQHGIGHESLRLAINWPGANREKRGRKPKFSGPPKVTEEEFDEEFGVHLAELGVVRPKDPVGQTDLSQLFENTDINDTTSSSEGSED